MTIERAQEGTSARSFATGDIVELRITKNAMDHLSKAADINAQHYVCDASAADQGAATNSSSLKSLVDALGATEEATIDLPHTGTGDTTTYTVGTNLTIPATVTLRVHKGARVSPSGGVTLTVNGIIQAGAYTIFAGAGTVTVSTYPQDQAWWGNAQRMDGNFLVQSYDTDLATFSLPANTTISAFAKTLLDDNDADAARATLGALAASDLTAASESAAGIAEIATHAETDAGTDDARIVTPDKLYNTPGPWRKNLLMNGLARIYQRPSITISSSFQIGAVDRWLMFFNSSSGTPTGTGSYSTGYTQLVSGKAIAATGAGCSVANQLIIGQRVEGADAAQIAFALAAGRKLSFQAKIYQNTGGACDAFINLSTADALDNFSAATQRYSGGTVSIPSATWTTYKNEGFSPTNTNFANGFVIYLVIVTPASMSGKTFYWGDIQLEIGSKCTDLEVLPFQQELALCQRFWEKSYDLGTAVGTATLTGAPKQQGGGSIILTGAAFKVQKRAAPTVTIYSPYDGAADRVCYYNASDAYGGYLSPCYGSNIGQWGFNLYLASGFSVSYMFRFHFTASAEL